MGFELIIGSKLVLKFLIFFSKVICNFGALDMGNVVYCVLHFLARSLFRKSCFTRSGVFVRD